MQLFFERARNVSDFSCYHFCLIILSQCSCNEKARTLMQSTNHSNSYNHCHFESMVRQKWQQQKSEIIPNMLEIIVHVRKKGACSDFFSMHKAIEREWMIKFEHVPISSSTLQKHSSISIYFLEARSNFRKRSFVHVFSTTANHSFHRLSRTATAFLTQLGVTARSQRKLP